MSSRQYDNREGDFGEWVRVNDYCPKHCEKPDLWVRTWDSHDGAYTDYQFRCRSCRYTWWVDGDDG